jgi:O-antigen ligase
LVVFPTAKDAFRLPKAMTSECLALLSLLPLAGGWRPGNEGKPHGWPAVLLAVAPLVAIALFSLATTAHPEAARRALPSLVIGAACLVVWSLGLARSDLERALGAGLLPASLLALLGVLQFHGLFRPFGFSGHMTERLGVTSLAGNAGDLGNYLVLPCILAQWWAWRTSGARRWLYGAAALLCAYGALATQTLSALVALVAGSALLWFLLLPLRRAVWGVASLAGLVLVSLLAVPPLRERVTVKAGQLARGDWNALFTHRLDAWTAAGWMLGEHPLAGVGFGAYRREYTGAKESLLERGRSFTSFGYENTFGNAHNDALEVGAELGWPGLLALAAGAVVLGLVAFRRPPPDRAAVLGGLFAMLVVAMTHFPFETAQVAYPWLVFLAWIFDRETIPAPA